MNKITISGNISRVNEIMATKTGIKYCWFDLCSSDTTTDSDGKEYQNKYYYSVKIFEKQIEKYKSLLQLGKWVRIDGSLKTYFDKNNIKITYIVLQMMDDMNNNLKENVKDKKILDEVVSYDTDGVMLWNGKRCETVRMSDEEVKEIEGLLSEFQ